MQSSPLDLVILVRAIMYYCIVLLELPTYNDGACSFPQWKGIGMSNEP